MTQKEISDPRVDNEREPVISLEAMPEFETASEALRWKVELAREWAFLGGD